MRNEVFVFVMIVLVIVGALAGYSASVTTTSLVPVSCSVPVSASVPAGMTRVYQIQPGSVGVICINYRFDSAGNYSGGLLGSSLCVVEDASGFVPLYSCGLELTSSTSSFNHVAGQNVTVTYLVRSERNATGVYWFWSVCNPVLMAFAIGKLPRSLHDPAFATSPILCLNFGQPSEATVTGVTGLNVSLVPPRAVQQSPPCNARCSEY